jgi:hypothetical protein
VHSSAASTPIENILNRSTADGDFDKGISVRLMLKNWSAAFIEWLTKSGRDCELLAGGKIGFPSKLQAASCGVCSKSDR